MIRITDFNKTGAKFSFDGGKENPYINLEELYVLYGEGALYQVRALYVNDTKFGEQALCITDDYNINLPKHLLEDVKTIRESEQLVKDINGGLIGFNIYEYTSTKYNKKCYSINWVELTTDFNEINNDNIPF